MNSAAIALPAIALGGALAAISHYFWREGRDLRQGGVETRATLLKKFRKQGGLENYYVKAEYADAQGVQRTIDIHVPSRQWHLLREGASETIIYLPSNPWRARVIGRIGQKVVGGILLYTTALGALMVLFGIYFAAAGGAGSAGPRQVPDPPPSKFGNTGFERLSMSISPAHDRIAVLDEKGSELRIRELATGRVLASAKGAGWRLLAWSHNAGRIAVAEGEAVIVLNTFSLRKVDEKYAWDPSTDFPGCQQSGLAVWSPDGMMAAVPCGNDVVLDQRGLQMRGHTERVLGVAWSPKGHRLASVSEDNYVRVWDPKTGRCVEVSEDYPYPRAIYFADDKMVVVVDVALRQYQMHVR